MMHANDREEIERGPRRRHRRRRRPQADHDRRHARRARCARSCSSTITFPEPVISVAIEPKTKADQEKMGDRAAAPRRGGPDLPGPDRRGDRPDRDLGHGRAPPRDHRRPHAARVQGRGERRPPAGLLPRDGPRRGDDVEGRFVRQTGGSRPVRPSSYIDIEPAPARASSSSTRSRAAPSPASTSPAVEKGIEEALADRRHGRLPDGRRRGRPGRRLVPRRRLLGDGLQDRRLDGASRRPRARPTPSCSSRSWRSRSSRRRSSWAT